MGNKQVNNKQVNSNQVNKQEGSYQALLSEPKIVDVIYTDEQIKPKSVIKLELEPKLESENQQLTQSKLESEPKLEPTEQKLEKHDLTEPKIIEPRLTEPQLTEKQLAEQQVEELKRYLENQEKIKQDLEKKRQEGLDEIKKKYTELEKIRQNRLELDKTFEDARQKYIQQQRSQQEIERFKGFLDDEIGVKPPVPTIQIDQQPSEEKEIPPGFSCEICQDVLYEPHNLERCGHNFCLICTDIMNGKPCPKCQLEMRKSNKNFALSTLVEEKFPDDYKRRHKDWLETNETEQIKNIILKHDIKFAGVINTFSETKKLTLLKHLDSMHPFLTFDEKLGYRNSSDNFIISLKMFTYIRGYLFRQTCGYAEFNCDISIRIRFEKHGYEYILFL